MHCVRDHLVESGSVALKLLKPLSYTCSRSYSCSRLYSDTSSQSYSLSHTRPYSLARSYTSSPSRSRSQSYSYSRYSTQRNMSTEPLPSTMKAVRVHEFGGPEKLELEEIPLPQVTATQVLVRIHYSGINYIDTYHRTGLYPNALPLVVGRECAGIIVKTGESVAASANAFQVGDRVALFTQGTYAEYVAIEACAPLSSIIRLPEGISLQTAAAAMLQGLTAHYLTDTSYCIKQGDHVLIHAAAGGTGKSLIYAFISIFLS